MTMLTSHRPSCALCECDITPENDSREHIIPNAIGGRLKLSGFICRNCNSKSGETWDAMLASQLSALCLFFEIVRERGDTPAKLIETTAGEKLKLQLGGGFVPAKPEFSEVDGEFGKQISITARSMDEAKKMLSGVKKKYPYIDENALLNSATQYSVYPKGMVRFDLAFGGELAGRSVVKSALAIACYAGVQVDKCEAALNYLRDNAGSPCFGYYYERDLIVERPTEIPLHCVAVTGNPATGMLLGYVEYFGIQRMVVCLSKNFLITHFAQPFILRYKS